jgi:hypothetical protein
MSADQGSHKRSFLRLRKSLVFGGINLYQELASIWFRAEIVKSRPHKQHILFFADTRANP